MEAGALSKEFMQKRVEIRNLQKVYSLCSMQSQQLRSRSKHQRAQNFDNERRVTEVKLDRLKEETILIAFEFCKRTGFKKLDLHGLYLQEAEEVVIMTLNRLRDILLTERRRAKASR